MNGRDTFTEGDGTQAQAVTGRPPLMSALTLVAALAGGWNLVAGLAHGPDPGALQTAMVLIASAVIFRARGDAALRGDS